MGGHGGTARGARRQRRHGPWHKRRPAVTSVPPPAGHHSALSGEELLPSVATWPHESDHDSTLGRGVGLAAPLAGQRSERPQKNKAHGGPVAPAQFSTEMALNDLESIGESIVMVENGFVRYLVMVRKVEPACFPLAAVETGHPPPFPRGRRYRRSTPLRRLQGGLGPFGKPIVTVENRFVS